MPATSSRVSLHRRGSTALITLDRPPVNAIGFEMRRDLLEAFDLVESGSDTRAVVLACAGRTFIAGADIKEFGTPPRDPILGRLISRIEACRLPVVAALHGTALGGGFEVALGCHYRIAAPDTRFGLPEVKLGIIPGAGGTQRLPRIVGMAKAIDIVTSGEPLDVRDALAAGLVDRIAEGPLVDAALAFADRLAAAGRGPRRTRDRGVAADAEALAQARRRFAGGAHGAPAPLQAIDAIEAAARLPFDAGLELERKTAEALKRTHQSRARRHLFFAARQVARANEPFDAAGMQARLRALRNRQGGALLPADLFGALPSLLHGYPCPDPAHAGLPAGGTQADLVVHAMINEAARMLGEGAAAGAVHLDVYGVSHLGWPAHLGGPAFYADAAGLPAICERLRQLQREHGDALRPAPLLEALAASGKSLGEATE